MELVEELVNLIQHKIVRFTDLLVPLDTYTKAN